MTPRQALREHRSLRWGLLLVAGVVLFSIVGPWLAQHDAFTSHPERAMTGEFLPVGPSWEYPLGADRLFRDMLSRLALGGRLSLLIGVTASGVAALLGGFVGVVSGYVAGTKWTGLVDSGLMRLVDVGLSFPFLLLVMAIGAMRERTTVTSLLVTLGFTGWLGTARVVRAKTLTVRKLDFIVAARGLGQRHALILWKHILPNVAGPLLVSATLSIAQMILAESVLSYLGVGISPPTPTWGAMLYEGQDSYTLAPWLLACPAVAIVGAVLGFNLIGEGLRDVLDPRR
jgi:ABC-type dipeptide/oligopeptide/nickel transport system permease subunit